MPSAPSPAPQLRAWSRIWRYLVAIGIGLVLWSFVGADYLGSARPDDDLGGFLLLDLVLGILAVCLLPLRRRFPVLIGLVTAFLSGVSAFSVGPATLAVVSLSTRRRWRPVALVGLSWIASTLFYEVVFRPQITGVTEQFPSGWVSGGLAVAVYAVCAATGFYIGARRELVSSLRDRAETAEREQALREESARESERTRIAREMHDVLAHHISLVSLHAGALTYRTDLSPAETAEAATVIQHNAQLALTELRQILGVLRTSQLTDGLAEPPQPTLAQLPALLADVREAGTGVTAELGDLPEGLSDSVSRAAYRIIQEALTNARKHAVGASVTIDLHRSGNDLVLSVSNPAGVAGSVPGSGLGLTGISERATIAGGTLSHGVDPAGSFVVTARLPW